MSKESGVVVTVNRIIGRTGRPNRYEVYIKVWQDMSQKNDVTFEFPSLERTNEKFEVVDRVTTHE